MMQSHRNKKQENNSNENEIALNEHLDKTSFKNVSERCCLIPWQTKMNQIIIIKTKTFLITKTILRSKLAIFSLQFINHLLETDTDVNL